MTYPVGVYATDIEPWNPLITVKQIIDKFYAGKLNRDLNWFVAINGKEFYNVDPATSQWVRQCEFAGGRIPVEVYYTGPHLLNID